MVFILNVLETPYQVNASALAHVHWLDDERFVLLFVELLLEVVGVRGQLPRFGEEVVLFLEVFRHAH